MKYSKQLLLATTLLASSLSQASLINFATLANTSPGESAWDPLVIVGSGFTMSITGNKDGDPAFAYLDAKTGGLGVCGKALSIGATDSSANQCDPSSDDNITTDEYLTFTFDRDVEISKLWFNNNHDGGFGETGKLIDIDNIAYSVYESTKAAGIGGSWLINAGDEFVVAYHDGGCGGDDEYTYDRVEGSCGTQFYVEKMDVSEVPEPGSLALLGVGIAALGFMRRHLA